MFAHTESVYFWSLQHTYICDCRTQKDFLLLVSKSVSIGLKLCMLILNLKTIKQLIPDASIRYK